MTENKLLDSKKELKVFIADVVPMDYIEDLDDRMLELENLVNTYWGLVVVKKIQKRYTPDYKTYIWKWKLEEIKLEMEKEKADILILWNILKPSQIYNINQEIRKSWLIAWDRVDLILKIFERHAKSSEARLQIELAAIKHMGPRIFGMWMELSRQWWWSKLARWVWETNTEIMRRHLREKELKIKKKLEEYKKTRWLHRQARLRSNLDTIWIVWYTNAGKSSLLNALTSKWVLAENKLFATLWTSVWKMYIWDESSKVKSEEEWNQYKHWKEVLLSDTIWFIRDLPPSLIDAFSSTLEDSIESKILLHVVDCGDPKFEDKIEIVEDILTNIWAAQKKIYVFNKIDNIEPLKLEILKKEFKHLKPIFISANKWIWLSDLKKRIFKELQ